MAKVKGFSTKTMRSFRAAAKRINKAAKALGDLHGPGLRMIGEEIMTDVKDSRPGHGVPVDEGTLRNSGRVEGPDGPKDAPRVQMSFGGAAAPYALIQHEVTTFRHPVGEPRYLVRGMERWSPAGSAAWNMLKDGVTAVMAGRGGAGGWRRRDSKTGRFTK